MREAFGLTREDVTKELGALYVDIKTLCFWENGMSAVSLDAANLIATLFNCYLDDFLKDGYVLQ